MAGDFIKCADCGRGCTYHRLGKRPWFLVWQGLDFCYVCELCPACHSWVHSAANCARAFISEGYA